VLLNTGSRLLWLFVGTVPVFARRKKQATY